MVGDFGGGGMFLAFGVVCALLEAQRSGQGQVVDTAMVDGAAVLMTMFWAMQAHRAVRRERAGAPTCSTPAPTSTTCTACSDGKYVSIGSIEPQFYAELLRLTGLEGDAEFAKQMDRAQWPHLKERLAQVFATKTRDEWCELMEDTDVCFAPVLTMSEAAEHPHNVARRHVRRGRRVHAAGAGAALQPDRPPRSAARPAHPGQHTREVLADWGLAADRIDAPASSPARSRRRLMGTLVCFHAHPDDETITTGGTMARAHGRRPPGRAGGRHQRRPRRGARTISPPARRWSTGAGSRRRASAAVLGVDRVVWLGYADCGMTGWEQNARPDVVHAGRSSTRPPSGWPRSSARSRPTC